MPHRAQQAIRDWKIADEVAASAERRLKDAWDVFDSGRGPPPSTQLILDVHAARSLSNKMLSEAMRLMTEPAV